MKYALKAAVVAVLLAGFTSLAAAGPIAIDPPDWWDVDDPINKRARADTVTIQNVAGSGESEGTYAIYLDNLNDPEKYKEVYLVLEWETIDDDNNSIDVDKLVTISWPGGPGTVPMILNVDDLVGPPFHWEYEYRIDPQPDSETVFLQYSGIEVEEKLRLKYDLRTMCFEKENGVIPEPSALVLLAGGFVGLVRRKRS